MTAIGRSISVGALLIGIAGCGNPFPYVGTWRGYRKIVAKPGVDSDILRQIAKVQVTVGDNGRFEMYINGLVANGSISHEGDNLVLTPRDVVGRPIEQQSPEIKEAVPEVKLVPNKDGTVSFQAPGQEALRLERIATTPLNRP